MTTEIEKIINERKLDTSNENNNFTTDKYQELLDKGLIKPRGYNIQSIDDLQRDIARNSSRAVTWST